MKVLHVMNALRASGMERMFVSAGAYFAQQGIESIIVGQGNDHPFRRQLESEKYRVIAIPALNSLGGIRSFARLLRKERPSVVHIHSEGSYGIAAVVTKIILPQTSVVRTIHNIFRPVGVAKVKRRLQSFVADHFTREFIACSPDVQDNEALFGRRSTLVYNWVDDRFFDMRKQRMSIVDTENDKKSLVMVGNSSPIKNQLRVLDAMQDLPLDLYFHGDESGASPVERELLDSLDEQGRVRFRGTKDPASSLISASAYVMPSKREGMSIALAEALVVGIPVIINEAPGQSWAYSWPGVTVLQDDANQWRNRLSSMVADVSIPRSDSILPIDLSAKRGATEYTAIYQKH